MAEVVPPELSLVAGDVLRTVRTYGRERLEFEFRLGHKAVAGAFRPGVDAAAWRRLKAALDSGHGWRVTHSATTERLDDRGAKVVVDAHGRVTRVIHKKRLVHRDYDTDSPWCARASVSLETEEPPHTAADIATTYERRKERWSYAYKCWSVDLTRVLGNLPHQLDDDAETYEVELELADTAELLTTAADHLVRWAWSIVRDLCALLAQNSNQNGTNPMSNGLSSASSDGMGAGPPNPPPPPRSRPLVPSAGNVVGSSSWS
jgi:hypothetical protein